MKLFTKDACPKCIWVKRELESKGIEVDTVNISNHPVEGQYLISNSVLAAPVLEIDGEFITQPGEILERLGAN